MSTELYNGMPAKSGKIIKKEGDGEVDEGQMVEDNLYPTAPTTTAVTLVTGNDAKSYVIPAGTKHLAIKLRSGSVGFTYAWTEATLTTKQMTVAAGLVRTIKGVRLGGLTIHFTAGTSTQVFEIETFA